jgi:antitoxin YefM
MQSVYRLKANELDDRFLESLKTFWGDDLRSVEDHREIEIVISEADETAYLMATEANRRHLLKGIEDVKQRRNLIEESLFSVWNNDEDDVYAQLL